MGDKFLIVSDAWQPQVNGVVRTYENIVDELEKAGHSVKVIAPSDFPYTFPMPSYPEIRLVLKPYRRLKRMIEDYNPDYIHIPAEGPLGWAARKYCVQYNKIFSTSYHTHFPDYIAKRLAKHLPFLYRPVHALAKAMVRRFHAPSRVMMVATKSLEDDLKNWGFKTPMKRMTRGATLNQFHPGAKTIYQNLKSPVALYVGRVAIEKNLEDFLQMPWEGSKVIVGDGPSLKPLSRQYPEAQFVGEKVGQELTAHYQSADLFVFPSRTDTFGIVLLEALASGLPIAAYNVTGPKDIITEDFLGALDENNLEKAARKALNSGTKEQRATYVKEQHTWENATRQFVTALTEQRAC